jgi:hypothetical protein
LASIVARRGRDYYRETACSRAIHRDCRLDPPARFPTRPCRRLDCGGRGDAPARLAIVVVVVVPPRAYNLPSTARRGLRLGVLGGVFPE